MSRYVGVCVFGLFLVGLCWLYGQSGALVPSESGADVDSVANTSANEHEWSEMTASELISTIDSLRKNRGFLLELDREKIGKQAASLLATDSPSQGLDELTSLASRYLSDDQEAEIRSRYGAWQASHTSLEELKGHVALMKLADTHPVLVAEKVYEWLSSREISQFDPTNLLWLSQHVAGSQVRAKSFRVKWTGALNPPVTGSYRFQATPFQLSFMQGKNRYSKASTKFSVGGEQVVLVDSEGEDVVSQQVDLVQGDVVPVELEFTFDGSDEIIAESPPVAQLFWDGPGVAEGVVPTAYLSTPEGEPGLVAEYVDLESGESFSRVDERIDFTWHLGSAIAPKYEEAWHAVRAVLLEQVLGKELSQDSAFLDAPEVLSEALDSVQEEELLEALMRREETVGALSWQQVVGIYRSMRFASPDKAIEVLGIWSTLHPIAASVFTNSFYEDNRIPYRELASLIHWQYPKHEKILEDRFLRDSDGGCRLPVAYTLAFIHHAKGEIDQWSNELKIKASETDGDASATWLLARAMSEELVYVPYRRFDRRPGRLFDGRQWLEEASLIAESPEVKAAVLRELAVRYASERSFTAASELVSRIDTEDAGLRGQVDQMQRQIERLTKWHETDQKRQEDSSEEVRRRRTARRRSA